MIHWERLGALAAPGKKLLLFSCLPCWSHEQEHLNAVEIVNVRLFELPGTATLAVTAVPSCCRLLPVVALQQRNKGGTQPQGFPDLRQLSPHTVGSAHRVRDLQLKCHQCFVAPYLSES